MNPRPTAVEAFYLPARSGQRFCVYHAPAVGAVGGALLFVHAFAEEMNKSRRMTALQARMFAALGYGVLQIDLHGCGDSSGAFGDATWAGWTADVQLAWSWLAQRHAHVPRWMWGLRAGCLLAVATTRQLPDALRPDRFLFWQPAAQGQALVQQFTRLRLAANALRAGERGDEAADDRADGDDEGAVEVAGYLLHPDLRAGLATAALEPPSSAPVHSLWFETSTREGAALLPATDRACARWRDAGHRVHSEIVCGPGFWQTQEVEIATGLIEASTREVLRIDGEAGA